MSGAVFSEGASSGVKLRYYAIAFFILGDNRAYTWIVHYVIKETWLPGRHELLQQTDVADQASCLSHVVSPLHMDVSQLIVSGKSQPSSLAAERPWLTYPTKGYCTGRRQALKAAGNGSGKCLDTENTSFK